MMLGGALCGMAATIIAVSSGAGEALAQAGLLTGGATELEPITLSSGQPLTSAPYDLESGKYYSTSAPLLTAWASTSRNRAVACSEGSRS